MKPLPLVLLVANTVLFVGCATKTQMGESVVFIGDEPAALAHVPARGKPIVVRSTYLPGESNTVEYVESRDFIVNREEGTLRRPPGSRLPDFRTNMLYGQESFDHSKFPGFGNNGFFGFVDYSYRSSESWPVQSRRTQFLKATRARLKAGEPLKIVAFGDSITFGGDATKHSLIYWQRWADDLQRKYPRSHITIVNGATGGDTTVQGLQRLDAKVLSEKPDLVLIAFGMNDHNIGSVPIPQFENNLKELISRVRTATGAEVILVSAFPPNPKWKYGSHHMADYAAATGKVAAETKCAFADVFNNWQAVAARKKPEDMLANNINHPNDFGHWVYFRVLQEVGL